MTRRQRVERAFAQLDGVAQGESAFSDGPAFWVNGKQVAHFFDDDGLELRLTKKEISNRRAELKADPRVELRRSASDWLVLYVRRAPDVDRAMELMRVAVDAHRDPTSATGPPPPTGADLARRRRFH